MNFRYIINILLIIPAIYFAQDTTISQAYKNNRANNIYPLIKTKAPSYPLMAGYLLQKYASEEDPFALHELGLRHLLGKGFPKDTVKAVRYIKQAADKELTAAVYNYAIMLENGIGTEWNPFKAYEKIKFAAENGMPQAQFVYGIYFTDNLVVNRNYNEAYKWFSKAAEQEVEPAVEAKKKLEESGMVVLNDSLLFSKDGDIKRDSSADGSSALFDPKFELDFFEFDTGKSSSLENLRKLYKQNFTELKSSLGINEVVDSSSLKDTSGHSLVQFAAERGSPEGLLILAKDYELGISQKKNLIKAVQSYIKAYRLGAMQAVEYIIKFSRDDSFFELLKKETDANNPNAMYVWAGLTALGFDYRLTSEQALELLEKAGNLNHTYSLIEKGLCYYNGTLVKQDREKAYEYWRKASLLGSSEAEVRLAFTGLINNPDVNRKKNIGLLLSAANEGAVLAQTALGYCYENGIGILKNKVSATRYYRSAANRGSEVAYNSLKRMYNEIRPENDEFTIFDSHP